MKTRIKKPTIFIQDYGTYKYEILVIAGASHKEVITYAKKNKLRKSFQNWIKNNNKAFELAENKQGIFCWSDYGKMLIIKPVKDDWEYWECLAHEIHHVVHQISKQTMMEDEMEGQAYLFEFLFRSIRRKLQGIERA